MSVSIYHRMHPAMLLLVLSLFWFVPPAAAADEQHLAIAVLDFEADSKELGPTAKQATELLIAGCQPLPI
jgi:hypothetical protein